MVKYLIIIYAYVYTPNLRLILRQNVSTKQSAACVQNVKNVFSGWIPIIHLVKMKGLRNISRLKL